MAAMCTRSPNVKRQLDHEDDMLISNDSLSFSRDSVSCSHDFKRNRIMESSSSSSPATATFHNTTSEVLTTGKSHFEGGIYFTHTSSFGTIGSNVFGGGGDGSSSRSSSGHPALCENQPPSVMNRNQYHQAQACKRTRSGDHQGSDNTNTMPTPVQTDPAHMVYMFETQLEQQRQTANAIIANKDHELEETKKKCCILLDENKILKKGLNIQENRLREFSGQNQQQQSMLQQAAQYIMELEKTIYSLKSQVYAASEGGSGFIIQPPPPDVF